jgi:hypothetical protein
MRNRRPNTSGYRSERSTIWCNRGASNVILLALVSLDTSKQTLMHFLNHADPIRQSEKKVAFRIQPCP